MATKHDFDMVGALAVAVEPFPQPVQPGLHVNQAKGGLCHWVAFKWCREFHRLYHRRDAMDATRMKVRCVYCGRKFVRERHVSYSVG
jgi:hypothetical protein